MIPLRKQGHYPDRYAMIENPLSVRFDQLHRELKGALDDSTSIPFHTRNFQTLESFRGRALWLAPTASMEGILRLMSPLIELADELLEYLLEEPITEARTRLVRNVPHWTEELKDQRAILTPGKLLAEEVTRLAADSFRRTAVKADGTSELLLKHCYLARDNVFETKEEEKHLQRLLDVVHSMRLLSSKEPDSWAWLEEYEIKIQSYILQTD